MPAQSRNSTLRGLVAVAAAILAVAIVAIGFTIRSLRLDAAEDAARVTGNISTVLAEQAARSVQSIDIVLSDLQERIAGMGVTTPDELRTRTGTKDFHLMLLDRLTRLPQASAVGVIDSKGIIWNT